MYSDRLQAALGIGRDNTGGTNGRVRFVLSDVSLEYTMQSEIDSTASMHIQIPIYFFQKQVTAVSGTITVRSKYEAK